MIPEAAVEAAARGMFEVRDDPYDLDEWEDLDSTAREPYLCNARAALEAAAPHMLAELRSHVADQILAANNAEGFTEFAAGWVAALKNVHERLTK